MRKYLTISNLFELVIVLGIFVIATRNVGDPDFGWHLRTGQQIVQTHTIPHADIYSHTRLGMTWTAHEWLSEVLIYTIYRGSGWIGLIATFAALVAFGFWIVFRRSEGRPYIAGLATLWAATATIPFWGVRPQIFSLLLASIFLYLLERFDRTRRAGILWWMPVLMVLWVNLHGGYALGLALIGIALLGEVLKAIFRPDDAGESLAAARTLAIVLLGCAIAALANPNGYRIFLYPLETLSSPSQQAFIYEWKSPDFHLPRMQPFAALLVGSFALMALSGKRTPVRDFLLLILTGYSALHSSRHIPIFALVAAPVVAASVHALVVGRGWQLAADRAVNPHLPKPGRYGAPSAGSILPARKAIAHGAIAVLLLAACAVRLVRTAHAQPAFEARELPASAIAYIQQQHPPGRIFNSYEWGGYLIWHLYPEYRVFVDGRADVYGDTFLEEFVHTYRAENDWRDVLRRFHVNTVILPPHAPLAILLQEEPSWQTAFGDQQAVILVRREPRSTPPDTVSVAHE